MLKREIKYEDFENNQVTETFYFDLTKSEIIELVAQYKSDLDLAIRRVDKNSSSLKEILINEPEENKK